VHPSGSTWPKPAPLDVRLTNKHVKTIQFQTVFFQEVGLFDRRSDRQNPCGQFAGRAGYDNSYFEIKGEYPVLGAVPESARGEGQVYDHCKGDRP